MTTTKTRRDKVRDALIRAGRDEQTAERVASKCEAVLFRDRDYGAAALFVSSDGIVEVDHGCLDRDTLRGVLGRYGRPRHTLGTNETVWRIEEDTHAAAVVATVEREMASLGYEPDALAECAMSRVTVAEARHPDLPVSGKAPLVHEAVEQGIRQHLGMVVSALRESGQASVPSLRFFARPNASPVGGRRPPFAVARFFCEAQEGVRERVLEALQPWRDHLVKCSVHEGAVEVGIALPGEVCEHYLAAALPTFSEAVTGARMVEFTLAEEFGEMERRDLEERCRNCTCAVSLQVEGNRLVAQVPSGFVGHYMSDAPLQERVTWLTAALAPWGASLVDVGELREVRQPEPERRSINEAKWYALHRGAVKAGPFSDQGDAYNAAWKLSGKPWDPDDPSPNPPGWSVELEQHVGPSRLRYYRESVNECADHGHDLASYRRSLREEEDGGYEVADFGLPADVNTMLTQFTGVKQHLWDTPQVQDVVKKAKKLVKDKHGPEVAKEFDTKLDIARATACNESVDEAYFGPLFYYAEDPKGRRISYRSDSGGARREAKRMADRYGYAFVVTTDDRYPANELGRERVEGVPSESVDEVGPALAAVGRAVATGAKAAAKNPAVRKAAKGAAKYAAGKAAGAVAKKLGGKDKKKDEAAEDETAYDRVMELRGIIKSGGTFDPAGGQDDKPQAKKSGGDDKGGGEKADKSSEKDDKGDEEDDEGTDESFPVTFD